MEYRTVGNSGLVVSEVGFGAATFGGVGDFFGAWGSVGVDEARAMVDACLDVGVTPVSYTHLTLPTNREV